MNDDSIYCTALNEPEVSISLFVGLRTISAEADEDEWLHQQLRDSTTRELNGATLPDIPDLTIEKRRYVLRA